VSGSKIARPMYARDPRAQRRPVLEPGLKPGEISIHDDCCVTFSGPQRQAGGCPRGKTFRRRDGGSDLPPYRLRSAKLVLSNTEE